VQSRRGPQIVLLEDASALLCLKVNWSLFNSVLLCLLSLALKCSQPNTPLTVKAQTILKGRQKRLNEAVVEVVISNHNNDMASPD